MKFGVLGPLSMIEGNVSRLPSAPKTRQLLALLLLNADSQVSLPMCVEELWDDAPPRSAVQSVHTRVFHIRQALAESSLVGSMEKAKRVLLTCHQGYSLCVAPGSLDLHLLEQHMTEIRRAQADKDDLALSRTLRTALDLWRGPALIDVESGPHIQAHVTGLAGLRITLLEQRISAELRLGMHHQLLAELSTLVSRYPAHEILHAQYMVALYRSGRIVQALEVYQNMRDTLIRELGIEPSRKLRRLQTAILTESAELDLASSSATQHTVDFSSIHDGICAK